MAITNSNIRKQYYIKLFQQFHCTLPKKKYSLTVIISVLIENHHRVVTLTSWCHGTWSAYLWLGSSGKQKPVNVVKFVCPGSPDSCRVETDWSWYPIRWSSLHVGLNIFKMTFALNLSNIYRSLFTHSENTPIQVHRKFHLQKLKIFS